MAVSTKVGAFNTGTGAAGSTVDVTCGFQPKAIILWCVGRTETTDAVTRDDLAMSVGFGKDDSTRFCVALSDDDGAGTHAGGNVIRSDSILTTLDIAGATDGLLDLSAVASWPADGFQVTIDDQFAESVRVGFLAIGGSDITDVNIGSYTVTAGANPRTEDVTTVGFQPDIVFTLQSPSTANTPSTAAANIVLGAGISSTKQAIASWATDPGATTDDTGSYCWVGGEFSGCHNVTDPLHMNERYGLNSMLSNGFRIDVPEDGATRAFIHMSIKGGSWDLGDLSTRADTNDIAVTGLSFQPKALFFVSAARAESTQDAATAVLHASIGAATGASEQHAQAARSEDVGSTNMRCGNAVEHDQVYIHLDPISTDGEAETLLGLMRLKSIEATGFTCSCDADADDAANFVWWVAVGDAAGASATYPGADGCGVF